MTLKLCKDCKHALGETKQFLFKTYVDYRFAKCTRQTKAGEMGAVSLVTGDVSDADAYWYCSTLRGGWHRSDCGPEGKFWEAKR